MAQSVRLAAQALRTCNPRAEENETGGLLRLVNQPITPSSVREREVLSQTIRYRVTEDT